MKSFIVSICFIAASFIANAQEAKTVVCNSRANLISGVESGSIDITFPETISRDEVENYAGYYKNAFTVTFNEKSHVVNFKMVDNTSSNRLIILRYLSANQVQNVIVEGKSFMIYDFYENFLK